MTTTTQPTAPRGPLTVAEALRNIAKEEAARRRLEAQQQSTEKAAGD